MEEFSKSRKQMQSVKSIYKIGCGPSSSHSMAPKNAAKIFIEKLKDKKFNLNNLNFEVEVFGSLTLTGKGHLTDKSIIDGFHEYEVKILWNEDALPQHPNAMKFKAKDRANNIVMQWIVFSIGGGELIDDDGIHGQKYNIMPYSSIEDIIKWCKENNTDYIGFIKQFDSSDIFDYLKQYIEQNQVDMIILLQPCLLVHIKTLNY